ncbi:transporter [Myxococcus sp. K38C18041901]|uniref:transporter n=1 Tax=Myxococcus guangdongensis TaxID=2906760 RepID=UPI0020A8128C|nr:transporter [Myxococcus guangdongensis]MCP3061574.1 transporter [Myxococcus guangdongensis]
MVAPQGAEVFRPTTAGPFVTFTALTTPRGYLLFQPILSVSPTRGAYDARERYTPFSEDESEHCAALSLFMEYGVLDRLAVGAQLAVLHNRRREVAERASSTGMSDTLLFARGVLLSETPGARPEVTLQAQVKLPTGREASARNTLLDTDVRGTGNVDLTVGVDVTKGLRPVLLHLEVLYTRALEARVGGVDTRYGDTFSWSAAGEWPFLQERYALMLEVSGIHQGPTRLDGVQEAEGSLGEVMVGAGVEVLFSEDLQFLVGYQRVVWGRNTAAVDAFTVTLIPTY